MKTEIKNEDVEPLTPFAIQVKDFRELVVDILKQYTIEDFALSHLPLPKVIHEMQLKMYEICFNTTKLKVNKFKFDIDANEEYFDDIFDEVFFNFRYMQDEFAYMCEE